MGVPVVGERHHGKANTSQGAAGIFGTISKRISGKCGSRRSSDNNQQSIQPKEPAENNRQYSLGAVVRQFVVPDMKRISFCLAQAFRLGLQA
jgi:hypothetical protein